ncbi:MAG: Asp/Glu/hydantoin racemase, partial [Calditrichaeota bacterium]|nr:Asp/Glu/hydantoin racemase [Calditrichota bacterium]
GLEIKVIGVIDAAARGAVRLFKDDQSGTVAVMATAGTVASGGYVSALESQMQTLKFSGEIAICQQAGIGLAGAIDGSAEYIAPDAVKPRDEYKGPSEEHPDAPIDLAILSRYGFDWENHKMLFAGDPENPENIQINSVENYISYHLVSLLEKIRTTAEVKPLKAIILGCTHYPFYRDTFEKKLKWLYNYQESGKYIYRPFMAKHIELVDPAENTAKELYEYLGKSDLFNNNNLSRSEFYISVPNKFNNGIQLDSAGTFTYEYKYGRKAGRIQQYVKRVPFSKKTISPAIIYRLSKKVPVTFSLIRNFDRVNPKNQFNENK